MMDKQPERRPPLAPPRPPPRPPALPPPLPLYRPSQTPIPVQPLQSAPPPPPEKRGSTAAFIAIAIALFILVAGVVVVIGVFVQRDSTPPIAIRLPRIGDNATETSAAPAIEFFAISGTTKSLMIVQAVSVVS